MSTRVLAPLGIGPLALTLCALAAQPVEAQRPVGPQIQVARIDGVINVATARFAARVIEEAERRDVQALVFTLDTPGGYDSAMRQVVQRMLGASVPVVVFVSPSGARAGSAGMFITLAADFAAMAPGTAIGAAHPVNGAPGGSTRIDDPVMAAKVTNDAAAYARTLAEQRKRNADWADRAVRESASLTATDALRQHVVDEVASDLDDLLLKLDGRRLTGPWGEKTLHTRGGVIYDSEMSWAERFLQLLVDPNVAYLLFAIGGYAILVELYSPGAIVPAVVGAVCIVLALIAFGSLPVNWGGVALLILAAGLFVAEIKVTSHGLLAVGGTAAFVLGSLLLFPSSAAAPPGAATLDWRLVAALALASATLFGWILRKGLAMRHTPPTPIGPVAGDVGVAETDLDPTGTVRVRSEEWSAVSQNGTIGRGTPVRVLGRHGLELTVEAIAAAPPPQEAVITAEKVA